MSRDDWKELNAANTNHQISTFRGSDGTSLHVGNVSIDSIEALEKSMSDKPAEGRIETQARGETVCVFFRVKDELNYYTAYYNLNDNFTIYEVVDGEKNPKGEVISPGYGLDEDTFYPHRITFWLDSGDDLRVRWSVKCSTGSESDPQWRQVGSDRVYDDPEFSDGGGIGIGGFSKCNGDHTWFDETKIYYPD